MKQRHAVRVGMTGERTGSGCRRRSLTPRFAPPSPGGRGWERKAPVSRETVAADVCRAFFQCFPSETPRRAIHHPRAPRAVSFAYTGEDCLPRPHQWERAGARARVAMNHGLLSKPGKGQALGERATADQRPRPRHRAVEWGGRHQRPHSARSARAGFQLPFTGLMQGAPPRRPPFIFVGGVRLNHRTPPRRPRSCRGARTSSGRRQ